jgi:long-chain acyl-CoA synthetase
VAEVPIEPRIWLHHYDPGVPATLEYPERLVFDYLTDSARSRPAHPAIYFKGRRISCGELESLTNAFAAALVELGVGKGARVALLLPNAPQFLIAEIGAWKAGAIVVPLNPIHTEHELEGPLVASGAETIVVMTRFYQRIKNCQPRTRLRRVIATNIKEYLPPVLGLLFTLGKEKKEGHRIDLADDDLWMSDLLARHRGAARPKVDVSPDDPAILLMSGGTTGIPKGVLGAHRGFVMAGLQLHEWFKATLVDWSDVFLMPLPLFHVYANVGVQSCAFIGHHPLALVPNPRDLNDLLATIDKVQPAFFSAVPTLFVAMLQHEAVVQRRISFQSIKLCTSGSAPLMAETKRRFEEMTGAPILEGYSLTEAMMACTLNPLAGTRKIGSVGMPLPDVEVAIVDADEGTTHLPIGSVGEIILRSPQSMSSYWQNPEETSLVLRIHDDGRAWLHTGDLGSLDADGYLTIVDRKKDLIKTSGCQVWPREIEEVIASHPAVAEVGVAGIPDELKGEVAKAWVVLRAGMNVSDEELRTFCREQLASYKVPARIEFRTELPKTMIGKVLRRALVASEPA